MLGPQTLLEAQNHVRSAHHLHPPACTTSCKELALAPSVHCSWATAPTQDQPFQLPAGAQGQGADCSAEAGDLKPDKAAGTGGGRRPRRGALERKEGTPVCSAARGAMLPHLVPCPAG